MKKLHFSALFALLVLGDAALAVGNAQQVTIVNIDARANGTFLVTFSQPITTPPSCVTEFSRMSGNTNTAGGKAVFAAAMLAFSSGGLVNAQGNGACNEYAGIESILILSQSK